MERPKVKQWNKYPWHDLKKKGDFFVVEDADSKQAQSMRVLAGRRGLKVSILPLVQGGYICDLKEDVNE